MKKYLLLIFCSITFYQFSFNVSELCKKGLFTLWSLAGIGDLASYYIPKLSSYIFGSGDITPETLQALKTVLHPSLQVKQAYPFWSLLQGDVFSHHQTLFVSQKIAKNPEALSSMPNLDFAQAQALSRRDLKVTVAGITIPIVTFGALSLYDWAIQKWYKKSSVFYRLHQRLFSKNSALKTKVGVSLLILYSYIWYLDGSIKKTILSIPSNI